MQRKGSVAVGSDAVIVVAVCDMSSSHKVRSFYKWSGLVTFLLKSKDQKNSEENEKLYNNNVWI